MSDSSENKYKWTPESTTLLVSVWTDKQVQKQLEYSTKPQLIWDSVAKYMNKKGYNVSGKQCRSRMKQVLVCYREAKRAGTRAGVEQYYESIDRVLKIKKMEHFNTNGIDTVDSTVNVKSSPKDIKTNKNLQMRCKYQQPTEAIYRTDVLSPVWSTGRDDDYPDSPESNETVLAKPFRVLSPVRDAATNTIQYQIGQTNKKIVQQNGVCEDMPIKEIYRQNTYSNNYFSEIPFQNTVQNVQNQIIQENMQQNQALLQQNLLQNQLLEHNRLQINPILRHNIQNVNHGLYADQVMPYNQAQLGLGQNLQNKYQQNSINNRAVPQEPKKNSFRQNLASTYRQFQDIGTQNCNTNFNPIGFFSPSISPDIPPNLNEAFCQSKSEKAQALNDTFNRPSSNPLNLVNADITAITNNATFNDDSISIEFLQDSPTPDNQSTKLKDFSMNTDEIPNAPFRKKKAEKLERIMLNAINSQNDVVNKILAAQNDMVTRVLDLDRDRQNRLENRLDHLLDVVQTAVLNKSSDKSCDIPPPPPEPLITNLMPPPKPGVIPPKLDLVPPKPCRVPCTISNGNCQMINQNPVMTRPGVISPILSPTRRVGSIWQKLGPVSTSPFVRAQQQLGFRPVQGNDVRTQSSAERRITKELEMNMNPKTLILETANFIHAERHIQEEVENARINASLARKMQARRRLFTQREPTAAMILTAAFLDSEIQSMEVAENAKFNWHVQRERELYNKLREHYNNVDLHYKGTAANDDEAFAAQVENYERLKQLHMRDRVIGEPCNSSTPSKDSASQPRTDLIQTDEPRQTIQQLAQLVMNSARWRNNNPPNNSEYQRKDLNLRGNPPKPVRLNEEAMLLRNGQESKTFDNRMEQKNRLSHPPVDGKIKTRDWLQDRYYYERQIGSDNESDPITQGIKKRLSYNGPMTQKTSSHPTIGFARDYLNNNNNNNNNNIVNKNNGRQNYGNQGKCVGFARNNEIIIDDNRNDLILHDNNDPFEELHQFYIQKQLKMQKNQGIPFMMQNGKIILAQNDMIERYMHEINLQSKPNRDSDSDNDEFLDTTTSMPCSRKNSITSVGNKQGKSESACMIS
ncbi:PREDICTED: uncharacterized protein LOC105362085 [Ceratosolen solmsi marchali]|uniref:Uncharacterized protein LOC105362085 n=1 Tax=Ceratosolen solmsi marchali TaxID=326594 RepID=A0AAJ6YGN9_9HYME|nr:PREDICTED: uncharacterized protein LOC105362085 [Ceratosolen solmsi marchali]